LQRLRELKDLKKQYRENYGELKELQKEIRFTQTAIDNQKTKLINEFEEWYSETFEDENDLMNEVGSNAASSALGHARNSTATKSVAPGSPNKLFRDPEMDADTMADQAEGVEGVDVDPDAMAYIRSRQDVLKLRQARKNN